MSENVRFSAKQTNAISELLKGFTIQETAERVGVAERTVRRWRSEPAFQTELNAREQVVLKEVTLRLVALAGDAVNALEDVLNSPAQRGATNKRLSAVAILEQVTKLKDFVELEERVSQLEKAVNNGRH